VDSVTCATPDYLSSFGTPLHPQDIEQRHATIRYFFPGSGKTLPLQFSNGIEKHEVNGRAAVNVSESTALTEALLTGLGVGQIFRFSAREHIAAGRLVPILEDWTQPSLPLQLVYPGTRHPSAKLRAFIDWAVELFSSEQFKS
jgi:DNA-binding transcriptional LysR family regulator